MLKHQSLRRAATGPAVYLRKSDWKREGFEFWRVMVPSAYAALYNVSVTYT